MPSPSATDAPKPAAPTFGRILGPGRSPGAYAYQPVLPGPNQTWLAYQSPNGEAVERNGNPVLVGAIVEIDGEGRFSYSMKAEAEREIVGIDLAEHFASTGHSRLPTDPD